MNRKIKNVRKLKMYPQGTGVQGLISSMMH